MILIALVATLLYAAVALGLLLASVHGPDALAQSAPIYFLITTSVTWLVWWRSRRRSARWPLLLVVALSLALAPALSLTADRLERWTTAHRTAATRVWDLHDEPVLGPRGNPIGIRVSFAAQVESSGYRGLNPILNPPHGQGSVVLLPGDRQVIDGRLAEGERLAAGMTYRFAFDLVPAILGKSAGGYCLRKSAFPETGPAAASPWRVEVSDSLFGAAGRGGREEWTSGAYRAGDFLDGVRAEDFPPCPPPRM